MRITEAEARALLGEEPATPTRAPRGRNGESDHQQAIIAALEHLRCLVVRLNAGGVRTEHGGYLRLAPAGMPDILVVTPRGAIWFLEIKSARGRLSPAQVAMHERLRAYSVNVAVVRTVDDAVTPIGND